MAAMRRVLAVASAARLCGAAVPVGARTALRPAAGAGASLFRRGMGMAAVAVKEDAEPVAAGEADPSKAWMEPVNLNPREVVEALGKHIVGQEDAKRAIAVALRNRWRRMRLPAALQDEVIPKNILMVGPTGCGKTEIARRLAKLCKAPFVKVEATKFTEVGYHGRDVDTIVKDLMDASMALVKELKTDHLRGVVGPAVEARILEALTGPGAAADTVESFRSLLQAGALDDREIVIDVPVKEQRGGPGGSGVFGSGPDVVDVSVSNGATASIDLGEFMKTLLPGGPGGKGGAGKTATQRKSVKVSDARGILEEAEIDRRLAGIDMKREAITLAEQNGIVVIDEIDKIVSNKSPHSGDASSEGVQRDLLPLIEGTTVDVRRYGAVKTDFMLFIACGAFHEHKPSDLLAELQGRLPIRVELKGLDAADLKRILTEPKFNLIEQQKALLGAEGITLEYTEDAIAEIAKFAADINRQVENIGARRLHTVIERIMDDISYGASDMSKGSKVVVDKELVKTKLAPMLAKTDLSKFIL